MFGILMATTSWALPLDFTSMVALMGLLYGLHYFAELMSEDYIFSFSRKILWLELTPTNKDPNVITNYYVECVKDVGGIVCICMSEFSFKLHCRLSTNNTVRSRNGKLCFGSVSHDTSTQSQ